MNKYLVLVLSSLGISLLANAKPNDFLSTEECSRLVRENVDQSLKEINKGDNVGIGVMIGGSSLAGLGVTSSGGIGGVFLPFGSSFVAQGSSIYILSDTTFLEYQLLVLNASNEALGYVVGPFTRSLADQLNKAAYFPEEEHQLKAALKYRELLDQKSVMPERLSHALLSVMSRTCQGDKILKYITPEILVKEYVEISN